MKGISIFNLIIGFLSLYIFNGNKPIHSSTFILNCKGNIPKKTACIIKASSFKLSVRRIDICQKNPFPNYKVTTDFNGAKCINLLSNKVSAKNYLDGNKKYYISKDLNISQGEYKYISIILENKFLVSGKYKANNYFWTTSKEGPKNIIQSKNDISIPTKYLTKLTNWRGKKDTDNKYCENNGGTPSRCDIQYNGYKMSAIGLDSDFIATSGEKTKFMFFVSELNPLVFLNKNSEGYFNINLEKNLEVFGNGSFVQSISIAPFKLNTKFISEIQ